jgi:hypothetical protein
MNYPIKFRLTVRGFLCCWFSVIAVCLLNLASCTGPTGPMGPQGTQGIHGVQGPAGTNGTDGLDGTQVYVLSGTLTAGSMNVGGWWDIVNPYDLSAPLASVYVRLSSAQAWWQPIFYAESNGDFRIINNQSETHLGYTSISGFEYRIIVAQF